MKLCQASTANRPASLYVCLLHGTFNDALSTVELEKKRQADYELRVSKEL
jgi:hypothetical protein